MNDTTTQAGELTHSDIDSRFTESTGKAMVLLDLLATVANEGSLDSLMDWTVCRVGIIGLDAIRDASDAFDQMHQLYLSAVEAQEEQS